MDFDLYFQNPQEKKCPKWFCRFFSEATFHPKNCFFLGFSWFSDLNVNVLNYFSAGMYFPAIPFSTSYSISRKL